MELIKDFIERNEDARRQLYDGDVTAFERSCHGRLWPTEKGKWGNDQFWDFARRTGHVRATVASTSPLFIKKGVEQPDTTTDGVKVPTDWYEQVKVWFVEKYVPAHANDSPHPNRNDSYAAACERFPGWPISRDDVWRYDIWKNHALDEWTKRGPK